MCFFVGGDLTHCTNGTSIMNPFTFIKDSYNHETLLEARKLEKLDIQLAKPRTTRIFNFRCLTNKVTPKTLQIKWKGSKFEQAIIKKAECSLIHNRIKCTNIKINHLQTEIANTKTSLQQTLDEPTFTDLLNIIFNNYEKTFLQYKNTQIKKLKLIISRSSTTASKMVSKTTNTSNTAITSSTSSSIQDKWVINLSKKELTPEEKSLLQKGPKFAVTPATIPSRNTSPLLLLQLSRQVNSMVWTAVASTMMSIELLTPLLINKYIQTSPNQNT